MWADDLFRKNQGKELEEGDRFQLRKLVKYTNDGIRAGNEATFELGHEMIAYYTRTGKFPGPKKRAQLGARAQQTVRYHVHLYNQTHGGFFSHLNPIKLISAAANVVSKVAPFVEMAVSLVPVAGQIYSVAKAAVNIGTSLAKGRPLTDAFIDSAIGFIPGGAVAQRAARAVIAVAKGRSLTGELVDQLKEQFPGAEHAITVASAMVHGQNLQQAAMAEVKSLAGDQIKALKLPIPEGIHIPYAQQGGFKIAMGVLERTKLPSGVPLTPAAALAIRERLTPVAKLGFDAALRMRTLKHYQAGSRNIPAPMPLLRGATLITSKGLVRLAA